MIDISNIFDTQKLAEKLANLIEEPITICLKGDLGAGKTTFTQFFIKNRIKTNLEVISPTFSLIQIYDFTPPILHCDFYRINNIQELSALGIEDFFDKAIILIEWPEIALNILPDERIEMNFMSEMDNTRKVDIEFFGRYKNLKNLF